MALSGEPSVDVVTRAPETLDPASEAASSYTVSIVDKASDASVYSATYDQFKKQTLPLGTYYVTAENYDEAGAEAARDGLGDMRLAGQSADVVLSVAGQSESVTVGCTVANAKVSVVFDASVSGKFSDLTVVLSGGTTADREITVEETTTDVETVTWFNPSTLSYTISGTYDPSGMNKPVSIEGTRSLAAKDNIKLVVKLNLENGQILQPTITYDTAIADPTPVEGEFNPYV